MVIDESYTILSNPHLNERTLDQVKTIYNVAFNPPESPCKGNWSNITEESNECIDIEPSIEDHKNSLNYSSFSDG